MRSAAATLLLLMRVLLSAHTAATSDNFSSEKAGAATASPREALVHNSAAVAALLLGARASAVLQGGGGCSRGRAAACLPFSNPLLLLQLAEGATAAQSHCTLRYVCRLFARTDPHELTPDEALLRNFISRPLAGPGGTAAAQVREAAQQGSSVASPEDCDDKYSDCPFDTGHIYDIAAQIIA